MSIRLTGHMIDQEPLSAMVNVPSRALEIDADVLRIGGRDLRLRSGDVITGTRDRILPAPWWWTLRCELAEAPELGIEFAAPGVGSFLGWLEQDGWQVARTKRRFTATYVGNTAVDGGAV